MDPVSAFRTAAIPARAAVEGVPPDAWSAASPCTEWSVRDVVNHLTYEQLWLPPIVAGRTMDEVGGDRFDGDVVGDDPVASFGSALDEALEAVATDGVSERTVHLSFGDADGAFYLRQMASDLLVHGWDIAIGSDQPYEVDQDLAQVLYDFNEPLITPPVREAGVFGPAVAVADDAPAFDRLLGLFGRDPDWTPGPGDGRWRG